jgi:hypothetical protein
MCSGGCEVMLRVLVPYRGSRCVRLCFVAIGGDDGDDVSLKKEFARDVCCVSSKIIEISCWD